MRTEVINGKRIKVMEQEDWKTSISEDFKPGDYFNEEIAWALIGAVPPHRYCGDYFQCGEPADHKNGRATYLTLVKVSNDPEIWQYKGNCYSDEVTNA